MIETLKHMWGRASIIERFLLVILPPCIVWDVLRGNILDLIVAILVGSWLIWDLNREGPDRG